MNSLTAEQVEKAIEEKEKELIRVKEELAALRKQLPSFMVKDYLLTTTEGTKVALSKLFGDKKELVVIHNMGKSCPYCTLWADGLNGFTKHIENKASFVLTSPDDYQKLDQISKSRGWEFNCLSTEGSTFKEDLGFKDENRNVLPGVSVLLKNDDGSIHHYTKAAFDPGDEYCSIWSLFELLPGGSGDWGPRNKY
ncbi:DUF899 domain-containing protein [Aeromicrobium ponti]|uniref:Putative dithiol-disulfide oxidoreductase (DUF899 family) n=1 Tax=Cytobacillus oceanisediminis TaxID=665099 RepID=A0A562K6V9_9BACI|nr:DUF899 family protein [Cytobacillus oceanisediminis]TWH91181.1 putative dithiol-disulfide oxidoreductase (DUF899 family) [Cytobacillus oceanisediminis]